MRLPIAMLLALLLATTARAALPEAKPEALGFDSARLARVEDAIARAVGEKKVPGAVVVVGRRGKIALARAYGRRSVEPMDEAMTRDTAFDLASLTKPVATATSLMVLLERGKFKLGDRVVQYLPELKGHGKDSITIDQLLRHRSGLIPDDPISDYADGPDAAWRKIADLAPETPPGERVLLQRRRLPRTRPAGRAGLGPVARRVRPGLDLRPPGDGRDRLPTRRRDARRPDPAGPGRPDRARRRRPDAPRGRPRPPRPGPRRRRRPRRAVRDGRRPRPVRPDAPRRRQGVRRPADPRPPDRPGHDRPRPDARGAAAGVGVGRGHGLQLAPREPVRPDRLRPHRVHRHEPLGRPRDRDLRRPPDQPPPSRRQGLKPDRPPGRGRHAGRRRDRRRPAPAGRAGHARAGPGRGEAPGVPAGRLRRGRARPGQFPRAGGQAGGPGHEPHRADQGRDVDDDRRPLRRPRRPARRPVQPRARHPGGGRHRGRRRSKDEKTGSAGPQPLRQVPQALGRGPGRGRRPGLRHPGHRRPVLHLHQHARPDPGGGQGEPDPGRRARPPQPDRRRGRLPGRSATPISPRSSPTTPCPSATG